MYMYFKFFVIYTESISECLLRCLLSVCCVQRARANGNLAYDGAVGTTRHVTSSQRR